MQTIQWYARRLRAMSFQEVWWRVKAHAREPVDRLVVPIHRARVGLRSILDGHGLFDVQAGTAGHHLHRVDASDLALPDLGDWRSNLIREADQLCRNRLSFFDLVEYDLGPHINWNYECKAGRLTPMMFAPRVDYRDYRVAGDAKVVWEPNRAASDLRGVYRDQAYAVEDKYRDGNSHTLSVGVKINVDTPADFERYRVWWDAIGCTVFCNGGGLLAGDFNHDCRVDIDDLKLGAAVWLSEVPSYDRHNLFRDDDLAGHGTMNFPDLAIFAENWLHSSYKDDREPVTASGHGY